MLLSQRATHRGFCTKPGLIWLLRCWVIWGLRFAAAGLRAPDPRQGACPLEPHWGRRAPKPLLFRSASLGMNARCLFRFGWLVVPLSLRVAPRSPHRSRGDGLNALSFPLLPYSLTPLFPSLPNSESPRHRMLSRLRFHRWF